MFKLLLASLVMSFSFYSFAQSCEIKMNKDNWGVKLDERQEKRMKKILKKKGYQIVEKLNENSLELKLEISYNRGAFRGEIADSKSSAKILKGKDVIASSEKSHCAMMNDSYIDQNFGVGDVVLFGATKEGAHRRLLKSVKELPDCDELI
jgi:hypothetical protein